MKALHYIGFDVHKKTISFCVKTAGGEIVGPPPPLDFYLSGMSPHLSPRDFRGGSTTDLHPRVFDNEQITASNQKKMVEAAGVELFRVLTARKLLILGTATTAKKAPLPDPLYVYCTKMLPLPSPTDTTWRPQYRIDPQEGSEKRLAL
jgi:hypothetical protein